METFTSMCFTGPRPDKLCGYKKELYKPFIEELANLLEVYYRMGIRLFVVGGAQGLDQLAFWALIRLKEKHPDIRIHVYVPFNGQSDIWAKDGCFGKQEYRLMLSLADEVRYTRKEKPERWDMNNAYHERNRAMVDDTDLTFALQNEMDWRTSKRGGTANCMRYADGKKRMDWFTYGTDPYLTIGACTTIERND